MAFVSSENDVCVDISSFVEGSGLVDGDTVCVGVVVAGAVGGTADEAVVGAIV